VVRPYAMTRGRTRPDGAAFDLIAIVVAEEATPRQLAWLSPEHRQLLELCRRPISVVDVASDVNLPLGVVRVLLGDLRDEGLVTIVDPEPAGLDTNERVLRDVLNGLRAL
jgi:Protein of unknown function (DUF742)